MSVEEFNRITSENKKLTEMLYTMYGDLRSQMMLTKSSGIAPTPRKRKFEDYEWDNVIKICESSANSDEELYLRTQESTRTKVSRVYVRVDPSDMSLVSRRALSSKISCSIGSSYSHRRPSSVSRALELNRNWKLR